VTEKETVIPLAKALLLPDGMNINKTHIDIIVEEEIPVLCVNHATKKKRLMPFKVMYDNNESFWRQGGNWQYYITGESLEKIKEKAVIKTGAWDLDRPKTAQNTEEKVDVQQDEEIEELEAEAETEVEVGFGSDYKFIAEMPVEIKIERLNENRKRLNDLIIQKSKEADIVMKTLVDSTKDAAMINHAVLEEAIKLGDDEAKKFTNDIVDSTNEMVKSSTQLILEDIFSNEIMNTLVKKSNGTIVQHMTRVYLNGVAFFAFYNNLVSGTSAIQKLRISFASKYRNYYKTLLPHINIDDIVLERVFYGGMRAIPADLFIKWSVGFLIHDIGKAEDIEYHESEAAYDRNVVIEHVKKGYNSIRTKTNYPMEAGLITGYHHEYYGDPAGYGFFRAYLRQYKKQNPDAKQDYCISYEKEPVLDYKAIAYFPAKVLEIIDVYDSVTDPNRVYRKALSPEEALVMMREEFIERHFKIDVILFDIFASFIREKLARSN
jgi:hypothetical protein